jgi:hypothetical protein
MSRMRNKDVQGRKRLDWNIQNAWKQGFEMPQSGYRDSVFVNCPFDKDYPQIFEAIIFAVTHCGFYVRCALEESDSSENRLSKIMNIISECKYSIHDISRVEIDTDTHLPRFNMPFELGVFLGARFFGSRDQKAKKCLILDAEPFRYRQSVSDIAGLDIDYHHNNKRKAIICVRNWLASNSGDRRLYSGSLIYRDYLAFHKALPNICNRDNLDRRELTFLDYNYLANEWCIQDNQP